MTPHDPHQRNAVCCLVLFILLRITVGVAKRVGGESFVLLYVTE